MASLRVTILQTGCRDMMRYSTFSEFFREKRRQLNQQDNSAVVDGSLAVDTNEERATVICRAPSRLWWEQAWQQKRR